MNVIAAFFLWKTFWSQFVTVIETDLCDNDDKESGCSG